MARKSNNKIPGPPVGYTDLLDEQIIQSQKEEQAQFRAGTKKRYFPLRPSAAGYCSRRLALDLMEYYGYSESEEKINPPALERLFDLGHSVEYSVLRFFHRVKLFRVKYKQQALICFKLEDGTIIEGSCDDCLINDEWKSIMDVKSTKDGFHQSFKTKWDGILAKFDGMKSIQKLSDTAYYAENIEAFMEEYGDDFLLDNLYQLNLYALSPFMKEMGIDHAVIYKYNKNDSRHYELRFKPSQKLADKIKAKFDVINEAVKKKRPQDVPQDCKLGTMRAAFCPCRAGEDSKAAWFKTFPPKKWPKDQNRINDLGLNLALAQYEELVEAVADQKKYEQKVIDILAEKKIQKIRLDNGNIYEVKLLKSPRPHYELRRGKL